MTKYFLGTILIVTSYFGDGHTDADILVSYPISSQSTPHWHDLSPLSTSFRIFVMHLSSFSNFGWMENDF